MNVVGDPYIVLWVVGTDRYGMRSAPILEEFVPLRPRLDDFSSRIDDNDAVAKLGSYACRLLADRAPEAIKIVGQFFRQLQLAAVCNEDAIRRLGEDAACRTPDVSGFGHGQRQGPFLGHTVRPG